MEFFDDRMHSVYPVAPLHYQEDPEAHD